MENMAALPSDPTSDLAAAEAARQRLTGSLRLPSWFHTSLAVAVAVQIATAAYGIAEQSGPPMLVLVAGVLVFLAVAGVQVARFRRLNGVKVDGLVSRAVLGNSPRSSLVYGAGFGGAVWAGLEGPPWVAGLAAAAGGAGYAVSSWLWWRAYVQDPARHARAESWATRAVYGAVAVAALCVLVAFR